MILQKLKKLYLIEFFKKKKKKSGGCWGPLGGRRCGVVLAMVNRERVPRAFWAFFFFFLR
jgi:hypothetical protein